MKKKIQNPWQFLSITCLLLLQLMNYSCTKQAAASNSQDPNTPQPGYVTGKVVDGQGKPVAGADILLDNSILYASYIKGKTDKDGHYKIKVSTGVWLVTASYNATYNGKTYIVQMTPEDESSVDNNGGVRNFTWKLSGDPGGSDFYGGFIQLTNSTNGLSLEYVKLVFTPVGPLIDGSTGQVILLRMGDSFWVSAFEIHEMPIGRYKVTAFYETTNGALPLTLQNWVTKSGFTRELTLDFIPNPSFTSVKNAASIEIGN